MDTPVPTRRSLLGFGAAADARGDRSAHPHLHGLARPVLNGAVLVPQFGDGYADGVAYAVLQAKYPDRTVVQLDIDNIASGGGIHCSTQSQLAAPPAG
ncbi:agmatine deiminase family protein [Kitasatospora sp. NPDC088779]|uniref:agmatine deiminase family protein n=1 Tax=Kitasatospora sp. NPDC088779 TaxID=3154964 RepID=UPI003430C79D